jgi:Ca2+-binding RTX toxin-like protein
VLDSGKSIGTFDFASFKRIEIRGYSGDDKIVVSDQIKTPVLLDGGLGNDALMSGAGSSILNGGDGADFLAGGDNRDILIGGDGSDTVRGNGGEDIVIAGRTAIDNDSAALFSLQSTWNSSDPFEIRVKSIYSNASTTKSSITNVSYDGSVDFLEGGAGFDWFFAGPRTRMVDFSTGDFLTKGNV